MHQLTKKYKFCAAHKYWNPDWDESQNLAVFGEDVRIHGHNYELEVTVTGEIDQGSGFIIDIQMLNQIVNDEVISNMDHSQIEKDIPWFRGKQPSTENMVVYIWNQISGKLPVKNRLVKIKLVETPTIFCEYFGPEK